MADAHMTNCAACPAEIVDTEVFNCDECGVCDLCEDCYDDHCCADFDENREID